MFILLLLSLKILDQIASSVRILFWLGSKSKDCWFLRLLLDPTTTKPPPPDDPELVLASTTDPPPQRLHPPNPPELPELYFDPTTWGDVCLSCCCCGLYLWPITTTPPCSWRVRPCGWSWGRTLIHNYLYISSVFLPTSPYFCPMMKGFRGSGWGVGAWRPPWRSQSWFVNYFDCPQLSFDRCDTSSLLSNGVL